MSRSAISMQRNRIVHLTSAHEPFDNRIFKQCRSLAASGFDVTLIVPAAQNATVDGVRIQAVAKPTRRLSRMTKTAWSIYCAAARVGADLYHFHDPELALAGLVLRARGKKVIFDAHENVPDQVFEKEWIPRGLHTIVANVYDLFERSAARRWSAIVTANEDISARLSKVSSQIAAIHNYPELHEFPAEPHVADPKYRSGIVIHCGGISPRTCIHEVIAAMGKIPAQLHPRLVVTGVCDEALLSEIEQMPGWALTEWRGRIKRAAMLELLATAGIALVLYVPADNHFSIRSNRFFEAMACGLPVIASDFPEWKQTIEEIGCGLCVDSTNPTAIAEAIAYLLAHPDEAAEMGLKGRRAVMERFNWKSEHAKLLDLYHAVLNGGPTSLAAA